MRRRIELCTAFLVLSLTFSTITCLATAVAWMGELVPWPMFSAGITGRSLQLGENPTETLVWEGKPEQSRFGTLLLGSGADRVITCVLLEGIGPAPLLLLDADNDENLDNDVRLSYSEQTGPRSYVWYATVTVEYGDEGRTSRVPYRIAFIANYDYTTDAYECFYGGFSHRRGLVSIEGETYAIAVASMLSVGTYSDISTLVVSIDLDRDGYIDTLPYSHEAFGPGEPLQLPTGAYRIVWASDDGLELHLEKEGPPEPRPVISRGEPAPEFEVRTVLGDSVSVPSLEGKVGVLLFLPLADDAFCPDCLEEDASVNFARLDSIYNTLFDLLPDVSLIAVVGTDIPRETAAQYEKAHIVYDATLNLLYRRSVGVFVIDQAGTIVAMDEAWATRQCNQPLGNYSPLRTAEIADTVRRLLH